MADTTPGDRGVTPDPWLFKRIEARVERLLRTGSSLELTKDELQKIFDAAFELRNVDESAFDEPNQNLLAYHSAMLKWTVEVLLIQLTSRHIHLPVLDDESPTGDIEPDRSERYRNKLAQHIRLAPMLLPQHHRNLIAASVEKLNDGSRELPDLFQPLEIKKNQKLPRQAAELEVILSCWVNWEVGRGLSSAEAITLVSKAVGWGEKSVQAWRTRANKNERDRVLMSYALEKGKQGIPLIKAGTSLSDICAAYKAAAAPRTGRHFESVTQLRHKN